jgi:hypothetical protein
MFNFVLLFQQCLTLWCFSKNVLLQCAFSTICNCVVLFQQCVSTGCFFNNMRLRGAFQTQCDIAMRDCVVPLNGTSSFDLCFFVWHLSVFSTMCDIGVFFQQWRTSRCFSNNVWLRDAFPKKSVTLRCFYNNVWLQGACLTMCSVIFRMHLQQCVGC